MEKVIYKTPLKAEKQLRLLHNYIKGYNKDKPLKEQIRQAHQGTAEALILIALKKEVDFNNLNKTTEIEGDRYGYFTDNGASIASQFGINKKTIDNHLKRLKEAKIAYSYPVPSGRIRKKGKLEENYFFINSRFFNLKEA